MRKSILNWMTVIVMISAVSFVLSCYDSKSDGDSNPVDSQVDESDTTGTA